MLEITTLADIAALRENFEIECKLAAGRDGKGSLPKDFWETYSAFANAYGGDIFLGMRELPGPRFEAVGIGDPTKVLDELWTCLNNPQKVSANILSQQMVQVFNITGVSIVRVHVPRAMRRQRPVYLRGNPLTGTYRRLNSSDCLADEETVRRMLAEQVEDVRDQRICAGFTLADLDMDSLNTFRNMLRAEKPEHPWLALDDTGFLRMLGGWREDRATGESGLTLAGLLMFGQWPSITEAAPLYFVDYQERPADTQSETRWLDRIVPDGTWSGNVFDFYRRVVKKLIADLKVPFVLKGDVRQDDTPIHQALREALVNTLVHADYSDRASILVVKDPSGFLFRNPGLLRVPVEQAMQGGVSDCRNRTMQQMFLMIGLGERAGSGLPKIIHGWQNTGHFLQLRDSFEPYDHSVLEMLWARRDGVNDDVNDDVNDGVNDTGLDETERDLLKRIRQNKSITHRGLADATGKSLSSIGRTIRKLKLKHLRRIGSDKAGYWEVLDAAEQHLEDNQE